MTECNGCGGCCNPVASPFTKPEIRILLAHGKMNEEDGYFMLEDTVAISRRQAIERAPWLRNAKLYTVNPVTMEPIISLSFYECKHYDPETRACTNYENRPPVCRDYPQYNNWPNPGAALPPECSFNADIGKPVALIAKPTKQPDLTNPLDVC